MACQLPEHIDPYQSASQVPDAWAPVSSNVPVIVITWDPEPIGGGGSKVFLMVNCLSVMGHPDDFENFIVPDMVAGPQVQLEKM